jgi:nucleolar protein 53
VSSPHEGTSYNPPLTAHQELLRTAHEREERRVKEAEELRKTKEKIVQARKIAEEDTVEGVAQGMTVQAVDDQKEDDAEGDILPAKKIPERKTKKDRRKAEKRLAEVSFTARYFCSYMRGFLMTCVQKRALAEKVAQKRFLASVHAAKSLRKSLGKDVAEKERLRLERHRQAERERLEKGLAGQRFGKHVVPEGEVDVQLGEDLSESFRALKVCFVLLARSLRVKEANFRDVAKSLRVTFSRIASSVCNNVPLSSLGCLCCKCLSYHFA